jgi:copper transport protein
MAVRALVLVEGHRRRKATSVRCAILAGVAAAALAAPAAAFAHATLLRTTPANGAVVGAAPAAVLVEFDDAVRVAGGNAAVDNATRSSVLGAEAHARGRLLTIPLRAGLRRGAYTVRWSIVSDDGHREEGVIAFAVGAGSAPPQPVLGASVPLTWSDVLLRTLYFLGVLAGGGAAAFAVATRRALGRALDRPLAHLLFFSLLVAFLGGSGIVHTAPDGTRYAVVLKVAVTVALVGGAAAALAPTFPRLLWGAAAAAAALVAAPTLAGHALDPDQPRVVATLADLAHTASASVWFGGLLALVHVLPRAASGDAARRDAAERFSTAALAAVIVLGSTGLARALTELSSPSQVWSTSYGRTLLVKTAIFVPLLGVGWLNRSVLIGVFDRLRRSATLETAAIAAIVVAVAVLTQLRPGVEAPKAGPGSTAPFLQPPVLPPRDAVVDAHELGSLAVAVARTAGATFVTILGPDGSGDSGRSVRVDGVPAVSCGSGCYRVPPSAGERLRVAVDGRTLTFSVPRHAAPAGALLRRVTDAFRSSRTIVFDETLASTPTNAATTRFVVVAPDRLSYRTRGGASAVVIGGRRWDRARAGAPWLASAQTPLRVTQPYWSAPTNAHLVAPRTLTFLDRRIPAWFRVTLRGARPTVGHMTAASHFMTDRYVGFDVPAAVSPPASR